MKLVDIEKIKTPEDIKRAPVVDAVCVIRCKNCKYSESPAKNYKYLCCNKLQLSYVEPDGYCYCAEKK